MALWSLMLCYNSAQHKTTSMWCCQDINTGWEQPATKHRDEFQHLVHGEKKNNKKTKDLAKIIAGEGQIRELLGWFAGIGAVHLDDGLLLEMERIFC